MSAALAIGAVVALLAAPAATARPVDKLDARLQQLASDYYLGLDPSNRIVTETYPYRTLIREVMPYELQKAIRDTCGDREVRYKGRLIGVRLLVPCTVRLDPAASAAAVRTAPENAVRPDTAPAARAR